MKNWEKWEQRILNVEDFDIETIYKLIADLKIAEENMERFKNHLTTISDFAGIGWWDGDFPIDEMLDRIIRDGVE